MSEIDKKRMKSPLWVNLEDELCTQCDAPSLIWRLCMNKHCPNNSIKFKRESRYFVLKISDINKYLHNSQIEALNTISSEIDSYREKPLECVCPESSWPMYEDTWKAIQEYVETGEYENVSTKLQREKLALVTKFEKLIGLNTFSAPSDEGSEFVYLINSRDLMTQLIALKHQIQSEVE